MEQGLSGRPGGLSSDDGAASVSTLRASIPDASGKPWLSATRLSIAEAGIVNHAMHARWCARAPSHIPPPLPATDSGWADLFVFALIEVQKHRAQAIEAGTAETQGGSVHESAVLGEDASND